MKKSLLLLAAAAALGIPGLASAQDITVTATVNATRSATTEDASLALGTHNPGGAISVTGVGAETGRVAVTFNAGSRVTVAEVTPLTGSVTGAQITGLTYQCAYDNNSTGSNWLVSQNDTSNDTGNFTCTTGKAFTVGTTGQTRYVFVGATGTVPAAAVADTYQGTVRVTIAAP